jgi:uncharacterized membrane protein
MSKKNVLSLLVFNTLINAFLVNLQILHITHLNWWLVFLPTWYSLGLIVTKIVTDFRQNREINEPFNVEDSTFEI